MALFFGFILTYPIVAACIVGLILLPIIISAIRSGARNRAAIRENNARIAQMQAERNAQRALIVQRYEPSVAADILNGKFWKGMTAEQLRDSLGPPEAVDSVVTKKTSKEVWKYQQETATRFGTRITLEDGVIVGWAQH